MNEFAYTSRPEGPTSLDDGSLNPLPDLSLESKRTLLEQEGNIVLRSDRIDGFHITPTTDLRNLYIEHEGSIIKAEDIIFEEVVLNRKDLYRATIKYMDASVIDLIGCRFSDDLERDRLIKENWNKNLSKELRDVPNFEQLAFNQEGKVAVTEGNLVTFRASTYCEQQEISPELTSYSDYQQKEVQLYRANPELYEAVMRFYVWYVSAGIPESKDDWTPEIGEKVIKAGENLWQDYLSGDIKTRPVFKLNAEDDDEARARQRRLSNNLPVMEV